MSLSERQPQTESQRKHDAWVELLLRQSWHWTTTHTFDPKAERSKAGGVHPEKANKAHRFFVCELNRSIFGKRWAKKSHGGIVWARGTEFHKDGRIHFHCLYAAPNADLNDLARRLTWMDFWNKHFGFAYIEQPHSQNDVAGYVSKYVTKGGEVDLSDNFGRYQPPPLNLQGMSRAWTNKEKPTGFAGHLLAETASQKAVTECTQGAPSFVT